MDNKNKEERSVPRLRSDESFRLLVESVQDYAIFLLSPEGIVMTWNVGAERIKGYKADEIIGEHFSRFYPAEAKETGWPNRELEMARAQGRFTDEGWRVRKDGTTFWASVVITALLGKEGDLWGFSKVTRDLTERRTLEERTEELNKKLRTRMVELMESRNLLQLRTLELQRISAQLLNYQDQERRRIARELHDDLGQHLAALKMTVAKISREDPEQFAETLDLVDGAVLKVRNLSYLLHPPLLDEAGLLPALHWYIEGFGKRSEIQVHLDCRPISLPRLSRDVETSIFRIIQECLTNIYRHSGSKDARVEIHQQPERIIVRVRDFGKGIEPDSMTGTLPKLTGAGIGGMRERLKHFGGDLKVTGAEPGTVVEASIPLVQSI